MAELQFTIISGSFELPKVENTSSMGFMWFNTASNQVNVSVTEWGGATPGTPAVPGGLNWSSGGNLSISRAALSGTKCGTQNSMTVMGGFSPNNRCTEEYNGSAWSTGGALIIGQQVGAGAGTQNAGLMISGYNQSPVGGINRCTQEYNGTSWSTGGATPFNKSQLSAAGTQNAAVQFGGNGAANTVSEYNGTSWTTGTSSNQGACIPFGQGSQNAAIKSGGTAGSSIACTEEYNGTSWSGGGNMIIARACGVTAGTQDSTVAYGGASTPSSVRNCVETYNGTSWSAATNMPTARCLAGGGGTANGGLTAGGQTPSTINWTTEFTAGPGSPATPGSPNTGSMVSYAL
jgi:hypothetical protein